MHHQLTLNSTTVSSGCSTTVLWLGILSATVGLTIDIIDYVTYNIYTVSLNSQAIFYQQKPSV